MTEQRYAFVEFPPPSAKWVQWAIPWVPAEADGTMPYISIPTSLTRDSWSAYKIEAFRDDLRNGWHVVPEGVRYVATKGIKAGQMRQWVGNADEAQAVASSGTVHLTFDRNDHPDCWCVLDLHDLKDHRTKVTSELTNVEFTPDPPRFQVKPAASMREGEPFIDAGSSEACALQVSVYNGHPGNRSTYGTFAHGVSESYIIDTQSADWQAFDAKHRKGRHIAKVNEALKAGTLKYPEPKSEYVGSPQSDAVDAMLHAWKGVESYTSPRTQAAKARTKAIKGERDEAADQGPTDAEIVEAWAAYQRKEWGDFSKALGAPRIKVGEYSVTLEQCRAAWSRELQKRAAESREKDRQRVVCEGTLESDY